MTEVSKGAVGVAACIAVLLVAAIADADRKRPELVVKSLDGLPATVAAGSDFEVRDTVRNKGRKAKRTTNRYFLSKNRVRESADIKLEGSRKVPRLKHGEKSTDTTQLGVPRGTTRAEYKLLVCADASRRIREERESNNCRASEGRIEVTGGGAGDPSGPPAPEITGTDPAPPANDNHPRVFGVAEADSRVRIYASRDCSDRRLAVGSAAAFNGVAGITVENPIPDDELTNLRATATNEAGKVSACSDPFPYVEDSSTPTPTIRAPTPTRRPTTPTPR